ncbi:MAG: alkaline phosphatase family protein [Microbacterium sp.]|uniref:alkaline phosphatase family protein n=1 Tax=Microbacterium sp. TaxID=51671 RepID=UPI001ACFFAA1|nr:nucleotide pyrophosphatase/phosphodiesterase family protein [Microbacterium sp.]MBN9177187.1 alkaline phosphatase family protein [Microbacterium sp.]
MSLSLPADPPGARSLTDVVPELVRSLSGDPHWFAPARSAVLVLVDGLGRGNLTARAGHARFLTSRMAKKDAARTVFPATTATALTSLLTGVDAGIHGIVGYRARIPGTLQAPNQLRGWETDGLDPLTWQRATPMLEREAAAGRPCFVVSKGVYAGTGFTRAIQRGATFVAAGTPAERLETARGLAEAHAGALVYAYVPELDTIGHARGWESDAWTAGLEDVDAALRVMHDRAASDVGVVVTADHGMVDVPAHRHVLMGASDALLDEVDLVAGEPRLLQLSVADGAAERVAARWREAESHRSWVFTRGEAVAAGLFGARVDAEVLPRIGDVLVAARSAVAYYDDRLADKKAQRMIGQHGSLTDQERIVPLIGLGAFARP